MWCLVSSTCITQQLNFSYGKKLQDPGAKLNECGVYDGCTISLIMLPPFELYIQGTDQRMHTVVVPSSEPEVSVLGNHMTFCVNRMITKPYGPLVSALASSPGPLSQPGPGDEAISAQ